MATFRSMYSRRWFDKPNFNKGSIMVFLREEIVTTLFSVENQPITSSVDNILEDKICYYSCHLSVKGKIWHYFFNFVINESPKLGIKQLDQKNSWRNN